MGKNRVGVIVCYGKGRWRNIGDHAQSLAAAQFIPEDSEIILIDRENTNGFQNRSQKVKCIMNGWFMADPMAFPPSEDIEPLYLSFHLTPKIESSFFTEKVLNHLKKYEPIGCRDKNTVSILERHGIKAYFSGCLTLTLGKKYMSLNPSRKNIFIVDPYCERIISVNVIQTVRLAYKLLIAFLSRHRVIKKISKQIAKTTYRYHSNLERMIYSTKIYMTYSNCIDDEVLTSAVYEEHTIPQERFGSEKDKFVYIENLVREYAEAQYVITSRIHCALPCLAVETPVVFVSSKSMERKFRPTRLAGRLDGLLDFFRNMYVEGGICKFDKNDFSEMKKINATYHMANKPNYLKYRDSMIAKINDFLR